MRYRDKLKLLSYFGFLNYCWRFLGMGFIFLIIIFWKVVSEFWILVIFCVVVVDLNILLWNVLFFIVGNDDFLVCLNYYCYLVFINVVYGKVWKII